MLSAYLWLPIVGAVLVALLPRQREHEARWIALMFAAMAFAIALVAFVRFDLHTPGYQFVERFEWIRAGSAGFSVQYVVGIDGLSAPLIVLNGGIGRAAQLFDTYVVDGVVNGVGRGVRIGGDVMRRAETGQLQAYTALFLAGLLVAAGAVLVLSGSVL